MVVAGSATNNRVVKPKEDGEKKMNGAGCKAEPLPQLDRPDEKRKASLPALRSCVNRLCWTYHNLEVGSGSACST